MTYFDVICSHFTVATFAVNVSCTRFMTVCYQHYSHTCTCLLRPISCSLTVYSHEAHWVLFTQYTNCVQWSMCFMQKNKKKQSETICSEEGLRKSSKCCPREAGPVYSSLSESSVDVSPLSNVHSVYVFCQWPSIGISFGFIYNDDTHNQCFFRERERKKISNPFTRTRTKDDQKNKKWIKTKKIAAELNEN